MGSVTITDGGCDIEEKQFWYLKIKYLTRSYMPPSPIPPPPPPPQKINCLTNYSTASLLVVNYILAHFQKIYQVNKRCTRSISILVNFNINGLHIFILPFSPMRGLVTSQIYCATCSLGNIIITSLMNQFFVIVCHTLFVYLAYSIVYSIGGYGTVRQSTEWFAIHSTINVLILILLQEHVDLLQTVTSISSIKQQCSNVLAQVHVRASVSIFY